LCHAWLVKITLTAKLKLTLTPDQFAALRATGLAYRDALNLVSAYSFSHGKTSSRRRLQDATYGQIRAQFGLPAQLACNVPRQVAATYKSLWTKVRKNAEARRKGYTKKRYKGLDQAPHYVCPTLTYNLGRDYSLKDHQQVSLRTLCGRIRVPYLGYAKHVALLQQGATLGAAKLWYDRSKKRFYLLVSLEIETPDRASEAYEQVLGIDVGQRYLATVASTTTNDTQFYSGKSVRAKADHYARLTKRLQQQGTRSATRKLVAISGRERRLKLQTNHVLSRRIVEAHPASLIGLEDLNGIRERTKRRTKRRKGMQLVPMSAKARKANRHASSWAFAELQDLLVYKAALAGSRCVKVDAYCTSQQCPHCGHTSQANRPNRGLLFVCQACRYQLHADLIGARNIVLRTLLVRQDWISTGTLSGCRDGADQEAKAACRRRYAELRWSPAPSLSPSRGLGS
jgi:putative transposase